METPFYLMSEGLGDAKLEKGRMPVLQGLRDTPPTSFVKVGLIGKRKDPEASELSVWEPRKSKDCVSCLKDCDMLTLQRK